MTVKDGGRLTLGGAAIEIPAQVLASDAMVTIVRLDLAVEAGTGPAFAFHVDPPQQLRAALVLHLPAPTQSQDESEPVYLGYRDDSGQWITVPAEREGAGTVKASVTHLSDWRSFDLLGWLSGLWNKVLVHLEGPLTPVAACPNGMPTASVGGLRPHSPLSICVHPAANGHATVTVSNRRHFAFSLTPSDGLTVPPLLMGPTGRVTLESDGYVDFDFVPGGPPAWLTFEPDAAYTLVEQLAPAFIAGGLGLDAEAIAAVVQGNDLRRCLASTPATNNVAAAAANVMRCLSGIGTSVASAVSTIVKHLPYGAVSAMLASDAKGRVTISAVTTLPDVGGSGSTAPAAPAQVQRPPTQPAQPPTQAAPVPPTQAAPPPPLQPVPGLHYDCANDNSNIGKYVSAGKYWQNLFTANGSTITGGFVLIGAADDGGNHSARVGIYAGAGTGSPLSTVVIAVQGYAGQAFTLPSPLQVTPGQSLYLTAIGIGDFTAYDNRTDCFIGRVDGYR